MMRIVLSVLLLATTSGADAKGKAHHTGSVGFDLRCLGVSFSGCPHAWPGAPRWWFNRYIHRYWGDPF